MIDAAKLNQAKEAAARPLDVTTGAELARAAKAWKRATVLGVDTEFIRERTYYAQLALIQVSDGNSAWLIDPLAVDDLQPFVDMLSNSSIVKILHAPSEDLELMQNLFSTQPQPMFDTQLAATAVGQPMQMSYTRVVDWLLGEELDSSATRSRWLRRPLSEAQRHYAALDVVYLPLIHDMLIEQLRTVGRLDWHAEDSQRMCDDSIDLPDPEIMYQRIREGMRMTQEQLNVLQAITCWREIRARKVDRPRKHVVSDNVLADIARVMPQSQSSLSEIPEISSGLAERHGALLLQVVEDAKDSSQPAAALPSALTGSERKLCSKLQQDVLRRAETLGVEATWLLTRKDLEALIRSNGDFSHSAKLNGWRKTEIVDEISAYLKGNNK